MRNASYGLMAATAFVFIGCGPSRTAMAPRRCVDNQGRIIEDSYCEADRRNPNYGHSGYVYIHHWYYGGEPGYLPMGRAVYGGTYVRPDAAQDFYQPRPGMAIGRTVSSGEAVALPGGSSVTRGVFGGTARGFAGGGGAGE